MCVLVGRIKCVKDNAGLQDVEGGTARREYCFHCAPLTVT